MRHRGSLSAMAVCLVPTLYLLAALSIDGGRLVVAHQRASDAAAIAARDGAQEIVGVMEGDPHVDGSGAVARSMRCIRSLGYRGSVRATRESVEVTVIAHVDLPMLSLIGIVRRQVRVTRWADAVVG